MKTRLLTVLTVFLVATSQASADVDASDLIGRWQAEHCRVQLLAGGELKIFWPDTISRGRWSVKEHQKLEIFVPATTDGQEEIHRIATIVSFTKKKMRLRGVTGRMATWTKDL